MGKTGVILCGHGSRRKEGFNEFLEMSKKFSDLHPDFEIECGFLEFYKPDFEEAVQALMIKGVETIIILPVFLFTGIHLQYDIPLAFINLARKYPSVKIVMARQIGVCEQLVQLIDKLVIASLKNETDHSERCLMLAGVGASVMETNTDLAKLTSLAYENSKFANATCSFVSNMAKPSIKEGLEMLDKKSYFQIIVVPVLLFNGFYLENIMQTIESFRQKTGKKIILTRPFGDDELVLQALSVRLFEAVEGKINVLNKLPDGLKPRREFS
jgi:sirohydrochlorin cobaltochelatase